MDKTNYITAELYVEVERLYEDIRIINSFENSKSDNNWFNKENDYIYTNEKEIEKCEITINGDTFKKGDANVTIGQDNEFIVTVPGAAKYTITGKADPDRGSRRSR